MFNKGFSLLLFFLVAISAQSQNLKLKPPNQSSVANHAKKGHDHSSIRNRLIASIEILPMLTKGIFEPGIEWKINKENGLGLVGGITVGHSNPLGFSGSKLTRQGFKVQPFYRHYWHKNAKRSFFMELNAGFYRETFTRTNDWYRKGDFYIQYDAADAVKKVFYGHFIMGKRYRSKSCLSFDIYGGVGAKLVNIEYEATKTDFIAKPILAGLMNRYDRNAGKTGMPNLVIGARVNFAVFRK